MSKRIYYEDIKETNPYLDSSTTFEDMKNLSDEENPLMKSPEDESLCSKLYDIFCCIPYNFTSKPRYESTSK